jgi:two-component system response regulator
VKSKVILLVEDNPSDVELTLRAFKRARIANEVIVAENGREALDYLFRAGKFADRDIAAMPMLILLDIKMPIMDGLEVLKYIRGDELTAAAGSHLTSSAKEDRRCYDLTSTAISETRLTSLPNPSKTRPLLAVLNNRPAGKK